MYLFKGLTNAINIAEKPSSSKKQVKAPIFAFYKMDELDNSAELGRNLHFHMAVEKCKNLLRPERDDRYRHPSGCFRADIIGRKFNRHHPHGGVALGRADWTGWNQCNSQPGRLLHVYAALKESEPTEQRLDTV